MALSKLPSVVSPAEFRLLQESGFRRWPSRPPGQPLFYPVTNQRYAEEITRLWNVRDCGVGYVVRFRVSAIFAAGYEIRQVGDTHHTEWWIPSEDLEALNAHIIGEIEVVAEYRDDTDA
jgi:hypothetical protein